MAAEDKKKLHPGFVKNARNVLILLAVLVTLVVAVWVGMRSKSQQAAATSVPSMNMNNAQKTPETPQYAAVLAQRNQQDYNRAAQKQETFIPALSDLQAQPQSQVEKDLKDRANTAPAETRIDYARVNTGTSTSVETTQAQAPAVSQNLQAQIDRLAVAWGPNEQQLGPERKEAAGDRDQGQSNTATNRATQVAAGASSIVAPNTAASGTTGGELVYPAIEWVPGHLVNGIDTDKSTVVIAEIDAGKYAGSRLQGSATLANELVSFEMSMLRLMKNGKDVKTMSVSAVALSDKDMGSALSGEVDRRYFERVGIPAILGAFGAAGTVYSNAGSTVSNGALGGTTVVTNPDPSSKQIIGAGVSGGVAATQKVIEAEAAAIPPKRVRLAKDTPIWIYFKSDVVLK